MTNRNRKLLDLAHNAPCMVQLVQCSGQVVPAHSDMLRHGRGVGHKSHDCLAVACCVACHAKFTRGHLGAAGYEETWLRAFERWTVYLWENSLVKVA